MIRATRDGAKKVSSDNWDTSCRRDGVTNSTSMCRVIGSVNGMKGCMMEGYIRVEGTGGVVGMSVVEWGSPGVVGGGVGFWRIY
jgi:hypothetical protein